MSLHGGNRQGRDRSVRIDMTSIPHSRRTNKSLAQSNPEVASQWHPDNEKTPEEVTFGSKYKAKWVCPSRNEHTWEAPVKSRIHHGCPYCAGTKVFEGYNDLQTLSPALASSWDFERNYPLTPSDVMPSMRRIAHWVCEVNPTHRWESRIYSRTSGHGCAVCAGRKVIPGVNDLVTTNPELATEWSTKNTVPATSVSCGSGKRVWWVCSEGHEWAARVSNRKGCAQCKSHGSSKIEQALRKELEASGLQVLDNQRLTISWNKSYMTVDILANFKGQKLAIEYDGSFWHKASEHRDTAKTLALLDAGYIVFRVREAPLSFLEVSHPNLHQISHVWTTGNFSQVVSFILRTL